MTEFSTLLQQGTDSAWLFVPSAVLLGALHGLEPGHSKTMMAAFIVAIRGTVGQAVLLGLSATISHTAVVWAVALAGMYFGRNLNPETTEPYFQLASAVLVVLVAAWMIWRTWSDQQMAKAHDHHHAHHDHGDETKRIDTGHGFVRLEIFEDGIPPRFRLFQESDHNAELRPEQVVIETQRPDGAQQVFTFGGRDGFLESKQQIPEPHQFTARLQITHKRTAIITTSSMSSTNTITTIAKRPSSMCRRPDIRTRMNARTRMTSSGALRTRMSPRDRSSCSA